MISTLVALLLLGLVSAHVRWQCPTPRSDSSSIKLGPCGTNPADNGILDPEQQFSKVEIQPGPLTVSFEEVKEYASKIGVVVWHEPADNGILDPEQQFSKVEIQPGPLTVSFEEAEGYASKVGAVVGTGIADNGILDPEQQFSKVEIQPGPLTVSFEETIRHQGSPVRIALSRESEDEYEECILLNHVPHFDDAPNGAIYTITIDIPDVQCENCALQLIQVMTDKIRPGTNCTYNVDLSASFQPEGNCFSNYHSCANIRINGTTPRNDYTCSQPADWPFQEGFQDFEYTRTEAGVWGAPAEGSVQLRGLAGDLLGGRAVPQRFNTPASGCGDNIVLERTNPSGAPISAADNSAAFRVHSTLAAATLCVVSSLLSSLL